jgi:CubicO group peptidase (beta-lactamase class C family)
MRDNPAGRSRLGHLKQSPQKDQRTGLICVFYEIGILMNKLPIQFSIVLFCLFGFSAFSEERPQTGRPIIAFEALDKAILEFMTQIDAGAATVAVSKNGHVIYSRGYGWADRDKKRATEPNALMRIASVTKPITAAIIKNLVNARKISLEDKAFQLIAIQPPGGTVADPRIWDITIGQLLEHKGGWDRDQAFDPMFRTAQIKQELNSNKQAGPVEVIRYMLTQPLQFAPGERTAYSNFGYCVLGRIIEKVMQKPYMECVQMEICKPLGITDIKPAYTQVSRRSPREVWYPVTNNTFSIEAMDSHGGLIASATALCRFMQTYWLSGQRRLPDQRQQWFFFGTLPGTTTMARQREDGVNVAVLLNNRREHQYTEDNETLKKKVDEAMDSIFSNKKK